MSRGERLFRSVFSPSSTDEPDGRPRLKVPFTVAGDEATKFHAPDVRVGGLGPFFGGALLLAALAALLAARSPGARAAVLTAVGILGTVLITSEGWWARLAPQLWLVPVVLALPGLADRRWPARAAAVLVAVDLAANVALVGANQFARNRTVQAAVRAQLADLRLHGPVDVDLGPQVAVGERLTEAGVRWQASRTLPCSAPVPLAGTSVGRVCPNGVARPEPAAAGGAR
jgi:hypothetical protein